MNARSLHPFPARMAPEIATSWLAQVEAGTRLTVLDPMCGSGTVLAAALDAGHDCVGMDLDPLAVLLSRAATEAVDDDQIQDTASRVMNRASQSRVRAAPWFDAETTTFVEYWFGEEQRLALARLATAIHSETEGATQRALWIALSRLIVTKAPRASLAADTSHSRPHKVRQDSTFDVLHAFGLSIRQVLRILAARPEKRTDGSSVVTLGDARLLPGVLENHVDAVITSPPYLNAIDYMRGHKMSLVWMGYSLNELRRIRGESIGSERGVSSSSAFVETLVTKLESDAPNRDRFPTSMLRRYTADMAAFGKALHRVVKPGGSAVLVVGNSTIKGNYVQNDLVVTRALEEAGWSLRDRIEREIPESSRYLPFPRSSAAPLGSRMRSEVVLTMYNGADSVDQYR